MNGKDSNRSLITTLSNAIALDANFYENACNTPGTLQIDRIIVVLAAVSHAVGGAVILLIDRVSPPILALAVLVDIATVIGGYYFWTLTIWKIGQWLQPNHPTYQDLLGPIGFAYATQVLNFLTLIPLLGRPIELVLAVWSLLAVIVAVRQGLDISTQRAVLICLVGWPLVQVAIGSVQVWEQQLLGHI